MDSTLFFLKKLAGVLLFPAGWVLGLWIVGAATWLARPARRLGPVLLVLAGLISAAMCSPGVGWLLLRPLEEAAGPPARPAELARQGVSTVVVLAGSYRGGAPDTFQACGYSSLMRLMEGLRLWRGLKDAKLVLSGGSYFQAGGPGQAMATAARELGVPPDAIKEEAGTWDTEGQARALRPLLLGHPFVLVTSASHLPRAMTIFRSYGLDPLPGPADLSTGPHAPGSLVQWLPQAEGLDLSQRAVYEYLGIAWYWLKLAMGLSPGLPAIGADQAPAAPAAPAAQANSRS